MVPELLKPAVPAELDDEPDSNMEAAAEVVEAIAVAEIGSGWLCVPS
jgi:hypothetical protein